MLPVLRSTSALAPMAMSLINRLDSLFDPFAGAEGGFLGQAWSRLPVAMWEDDDHFHVEAELPGVADEDVEVSVQDDTLFIRGQRKPEEGRQYLYNGRWFGRFERVITLPETVHADDAEAKLIDGVLRIDLPKSPEARPKRISFKTS